MKPQALAAAFLAFATTAIAQTTVFNTGFESSEGYNTGPILASHAVWRQKGDMDFMIVPRDGDSSNQMAECRSLGGGMANRLWVTGVDFPDGKTAIEFEIRLQRSGSRGFQANIHVGNFPAAPGIKPEGMAVSLSFRGSSRIIALDGDTEIEIGNWKSEDWMLIRIELDSKEKTYSIYLNDELLAADYAFRDSEASPIRSFGMTYYTGSDASNESAVAIDSFKITNP